MDKQELLELIKSIQKDKGGNIEDYLEFISFIGHVESNNKPDAIQKNSGIAKGAFQFEDNTGSNRILTAAQRTKNYYDYINKSNKVPKFIKDIIENSTGDASKLTYNQQAMLLLGDARMGNADLKNFIGKGREKLSDYWVTHHWGGHKGLETLKTKKLNSFNNNINNYFDNKEEIINTTKNYIGLDNQQSANNKFKANSSFQTGSPYESTQDNLDKFQYINKQKEDKLNEFQYIDNKKQDFNKQSLQELIQSQVPSNKKALGGFLGSNNSIKSKNLNEFNTGGLHSQNRLGGIPVGIGSNGKTNTVEEGETSFETKKGKFIFSNRLKI